MSEIDDKFIIYRIKLRVQIKQISASMNLDFFLYICFLELELKSNRRIGT